MRLAIVDSGPLYAAVDAGDDDHRRCAELLEDTELRLIVPALVVAEVTYLVGTRLGPEVEAKFLRGLAVLDVRPPHSKGWDRIAELVDEYADFPLGGTDASVIALAEHLNVNLILTLDRRHFGAVRPLHCESLELRPG